MPISDNTIVREGLRQLERRLPPDWQLGPATQARGGTGATATITAPDRRSSVLELEARGRLDPKGAAAFGTATQETRAKNTVVVVSPYLSASTRDRLRDSGVGYVDLTGNVRLVMSRPGLFIETQGAQEDPAREERKARSLRGAKAGRLVRALVDSKLPRGVRELATAASIDAGYVSRVLAFLDAEALVKREGRGRMQSVDWAALLRRWAADAPLEARGQVRTYLEPRGLPALMTRLAKSKERYAVSGGLAAAQLAPVAPTRLATIWMQDAEQAASRLALRPADSGANVLLVEPADDGVFVRMTKVDDIWYAAPSQVVVDLLTSPGRGPAEAEELITWMSTHEERWRG